MHVILVRHGQTDWNRGGLFRGRIDVELNGAGLGEARSIGEKLSPVDPDAVYSSPLSRALETARIIASFHGKSVRVLEGLVDMDFGAWQGLSREEARARYPRAYGTWESAPHRARIPGAETLGGVRKRALGSLGEAYGEHPDGTVVLVSHGLVNKVLLCAVLGLSDARFWKIKQDNGAINIFTISGGGTKLLLLNDTTHLGTVADIIEGMRSPDNPLG